MYRHLVNEIYHTVMYTLLPIDHSTARTDFERTDFELVLVPDWLSCTLTMYMTVNHRPELTSCT